MATQKIFIISDSIGETARLVTSAGLAQFPDWEDVSVERFVFIKKEADLMPILNRAKAENALITATIINPTMDALAQKFADEAGLPYINYMRDILRTLSEVSGQTIAGKVGAVHQLDQEYFQRISAMEFAVKYDDGKNFLRAIEAADLIILGISRTSKTPLSMFLANKGYKVCNLPLLPEVQVPDELYQLTDKHIIGLTASPRYIMNVRHQRLKYLGLNEMANYINMDRIKEELVYADELYQALDAKIINVENKSIEESAAEIERSIQDIS